jgi:uncharacterized membrane protein
VDLAFKKYSISRSSTFIIHTDFWVFIFNWDFLHQGLEIARIVSVILTKHKGKHMGHRKLATFLVVFIISGVLIACSSATPNTQPASPSSNTSSAQSSSTLDGAALIQQRCTICHSISRIQSAHHNAAEWQTIVDAMVQRGAQLSADEENVVVDYLTATYGP